MCGVKVGEFFGKHGAVWRGVNLFEIIAELPRRRVPDEIQVHHAQVRPFDEFAVAALQFLMQRLRIFSEWPVKRIANDGCLPRKNFLRGIRRFREIETVNQKSAEEDADVRRAGHQHQRAVLAVEFEAMAAAEGETETPAEKPAGPAVAAAPAEPVGYRRPANIKDLYSRYNDLITATVMRDRAAVKELLDDGKTPNVRQADGTTPLMIAVSNGDADIAGMLLAKGADPNLRAQGGVTALSIARTRAGGGQLYQQLQRAGARE